MYYTFYFKISSIKKYGLFCLFVCFRVKGQHWSRVRTSSCFGLKYLCYIWTCCVWKCIKLAFILATGLLCKNITTLYKHMIYDWKICYSETNRLVEIKRVKQLWQCIFLHNRPHVLMTRSCLRELLKGVATFSAFLPPKPLCRKEEEEEEKK